MNFHLTKEQITQLAPDDASVKAAKGLTNLKKWPLLQFSDRAVWGHCQGSGSKPYQMAVDMKDMTARCSCPSRKFPCKHSLGLLFLLEMEAQAFSPAEEPDWVAEWLAKREAKAEVKAKKAEAPVDEAAKEKRVEQRHSKVLDGIDELQTTFHDLLRNGLFNLPNQGFGVFERLAKRLVDAQAGGLAAQVQTLLATDYEDDEWKSRVMMQLSRIYLMAESYKHLEQLPPEWQTTLRTAVGFTQAKEEVLATEGFRDEWWCVWQSRSLVNKLNMEVSWLYGLTHDRFATIVQFFPHSSTPEWTVVTGAIYAATLHFYPAVSPMRAIPEQLERVETPLIFNAISSVDDLLRRYRTQMGIDPLLDAYPALVEQVQLCRSGKSYFLKDKDGNLLKVSLTDNVLHRVLAVTGGDRFTAFLLGSPFGWTINAFVYESKHYIVGNETN